ncbi:MAG: hypothetical protein GXP27_11040 [Planctomycetes bacterium]|nr:hypothetical protein [Planctomycetota bacterium]
MRKYSWVEELSRKRVWFLGVCLMLGLAVLSVPAVGVAQQAAERSEVKPLRPVAMVNVAAIDRVLADVDYVFAAAGRPEFSDFVASLLANVRDFAGIDRKKPLGLMVFVDPSVDLKPIPVGYLPVEDMNELIKTFSAGTFTIKRAEKAGYYEVIGRRGILQMRQVGGYAFIAEEVETLQQDLPDPAGLTSSLTSNYDVAVMVDLRDVPDALRTVFAQGLRTSAEAELRQREKESDEQYRFRRASAESVLELLEMAIEDGQVLKVGFRASPQAHMAVLEADLQVKSDSDFSEYLQRIAGRRSQFEGLLNAEAPFTFSTSWSLGQQGRASLTELINMLERRISAELGGSPADKAPVTQLADVFRRTARDGHLDFFIQMRRYDPGLFVLVGGMKVTDGQKTAQALAQILQKINDRSELAELQLNALSYKGVTVHRVRGQRVSRRDQRLYGGSPHCTSAAEARRCGSPLAERTRFRLCVPPLIRLSRAAARPPAVRERLSGSRST